MPRRQASQRKLTMTSKEQMLLYGLYKQAVAGNAPKRSFSISPAALAKLKVWNRVSKTVPDDKLQEAFEHLDQALQVIEEHSKEVVIAPKRQGSKNKRSFGLSASPGRNRKSNQKNNRNNTQPESNNNNNTTTPEMAPPSPMTDVKTEETLSPEEMLLLAAAEDDELTIRTLLENEQVALDVNYQDDLGQTALHIAADKGHTAVVSVLLEQGGDELNVDATDHDGISVLQAAVIGGHYPICKTLLESGADPDQPDQDGDTARLCAMDDGSVTLRDLFDATLPKHALASNADDDDEEEDEEHPIFSGNEEDYEDDQESCGSWRTDFTDNVNQGVVDRVPSYFQTRKKQTAKA